MRLDNEKPSDNVEDRRGQGGGGGGFGMPGGGMGGRRMNIPMGGGKGGFSISTIVLMVVAYLALKFLFGVDLLDMVNGGGGMQVPGGQQTEYQIPNAQTDVTEAQVPGTGTGSANVDSDAGKDFVARVLGSTERTWDSIFQKMGKQLSKAAIGDVLRLRAISLRHGAIGHGPVLLPTRFESLYRPLVLSGHEKQIGRARRFRASLRHRP